MVNKLETTNWYPTSATTEIEEKRGKPSIGDKINRLARIPVIREVNNFLTNHFNLDSSSTTKK